MADNPSAALVAITDQQATAVREVATVLGRYYGGLIEAGIPQENASELVAAYAETYWGMVWHRCCPCGTLLPDF